MQNIFQNLNNLTADCNIKLIPDMTDKDFVCRFNRSIRIPKVESIIAGNLKVSKFFKRF